MVAFIMAVQNVTQNVKQNIAKPWREKNLLNMAGYKVEFMWECVESDQG